MSFAAFAAPFAAGLAGKLFGGGRDRMRKVPTMDPRQQQLLQQIMSMLGPGGQLGQGYTGSVDYMRQLMDPSSEAVQRFAQPYMQQFEQQTVPGLAERFAGGGAMGGGLSSSGFGQALSSAGGNLQAKLAALKSGLGMQASQQLMSQYGGMAGRALGTPTFAYQQRAPSTSSGMMAGWGQAGYPGMEKAGQGFADLWQNYFPIMGNV